MKLLNKTFLAHYGTCYTLLTSPDLANSILDMDPAEHLDDADVLEVLNIIKEANELNVVPISCREVRGEDGWVLAKITFIS